MKNSVYNFDNVKEWEKEYNKCLSICKVSKIFNVDRNTIRFWFNKFKNDLNLINQKKLAECGFKFCSSCNIIKSLHKFGQLSRSIDGYNGRCKKCRNVESYDNQKFRTKIMLKFGRKKCVGKYGCGKIKQLDDFYNNSGENLYGKSVMCKTCYKIRLNNLLQKKEKPSIISKKCNGKHGCGREKNISEFYYNERRKYYNASCKKCESKANTNTLQKKMASFLRSRVRIAIKNKQKNGSAINDLGCSVSELIKYLETKFKNGMTWDNWSYNGWHIDHVIPLSAFDLSKRDHMIFACHYTNLQPLWAKDNFSKGNKLNWEK